MWTVIKEKMVESLKSVLPIALIVLLVSVAFTPLLPGTVLVFIIGVVALVIGMGFFNLGADTAMLNIGNKIGARLTGSRKMWLIALVSFVLGMIITLAEPDLRILSQLVFGDDIAQQFILMGVVGVGVGLFLVVAMFRIIFRVPLNILLFVSYACVFVLCFFVPEGFRAVAFDSGGVTTGPMTVPFLMSLGIGVASMRGGKNTSNDSFGLIALSSVGPIIAVEVLGIAMNIQSVVFNLEDLVQIADTQAAAAEFGVGLGQYALEVLIAITPILAFFLLAQLFTRAFTKHQFIKILVGFLYTYIGMMIFLTGANVGFMPVGRRLGEKLATLWNGAMLIPVAMVFGYFVVSAEPAVHVLTKQVRRMSAGAISERSMKLSLCIGVSISLGLSMLRILTGISILWILIPGYVIAIALSFFTPKMYTGIAFDSGGVASGAMVSAFILPMAMGACDVLKVDIGTQAFGCVAFVALTPLITIQILGLFHKFNLRRAARQLTIAEDGLTEYEVDYATETD